MAFNCNAASQLHPVFPAHVYKLLRIAAFSYLPELLFRWLHRVDRPPAKSTRNWMNDVDWDMCRFTCTLTCTSFVLNRNDANTRSWATSSLGQRHVNRNIFSLTLDILMYFLRATFSRSFVPNNEHKKQHKNNHKINSKGTKWIERGDSVGGSQNFHFKY